MNHKRKKPKNTSRAGCLMCKPYKRVGCEHEFPRKSDLRDKEEIKQQMKDME